MQFRTIDPEQLRGIFDKVFGLTKEIFGEVFGNERLRQEGDAQQAKGTEKLKAIRQQAKADAHKSKAKAYESKERAAQSAKA